jgi:hypothetical protein
MEMPDNKILLAYKMYGELGIQRLSRCFEEQKKYPDCEKLDRLVVTDKGTEVDFPRTDVIRLPDAITFDDAPFSRMRNMSMRYAKEKGYTHILLLDADAVVISLKEVRDGLWWTKMIPDPEFSTTERYYPYFWFLLPSALFELWWDESYYGMVGWDDVDYQDNVLRMSAADYYHGGVTGDHLDHSMLVNTASPAFKKNQTIYYSKREKLGNMKPCDCRIEPRKGKWR